MSYAVPGVGEDFSLRVIFKLDGPIPLRWACTHEFSTNVGGDTENIDNFAISMMGFHSRLLLTPYQVEKAVVSTLAEDGQPYDPTSFKVYDGVGYGVRPLASSDVYDLNNVLVCNRLVEYGRVGHMFLRGFLLETDVSSVGGRVALADTAATNTLLQTAVTGAGINTYFGGGDVQLYMIRPGLVNNEERAISGFSVTRMGQKKLNNKWFNRA